jgi:hypothetical protein
MHEFLPCTGVTSRSECLMTHCVQCFPLTHLGLHSVRHGQLQVAEEVMKAASRATSRGGVGESSIDACGGNFEALPGSLWDYTALFTSLRHLYAYRRVPSSEASCFRCRQSKSIKNYSVRTIGKKMGIVVIVGH